MPAPTDGLVPDWPAPPAVRSLFTTRAGGCSAAPCDSFNLGDHVRDDPASVAANRQHLGNVIGAKPVFLRQVHGTSVAWLNGQVPDGTQADACITDQPGVACTIMVADCLPVLFAHASGTVVGAAHAGWRGLAGHGAEPSGQGVLETTFEALVTCVRRVDPMASRASVAASTLAWLGPCIGPGAFEVGPEVMEAFLAHGASAKACFTAAAQPGKHMANLSALARLRLRAIGITRVYGNDGAPSWCTYSNGSRFFSHRRDAVRLGTTGRMAACIAIN